MVLAGAISLALAMLTTGNLSLFPPRLKTSELQVAAATTHVMIDTGGLSAVHRIEDRVPGLTKRAELFGRVLVSPPIVARIARMAHVPPDELAASARFTADLPQAFTEPASEQRAVELLTSGSRYRIEAQARQATPVLDIHTQAPTVAAAENIANAAVVALRAQVAEVAAERGYSRLRSRSACASSTPRGADS